ncbi:MAG: T9SS type A sorting domain-containing protein [bacterium]
MFGVYPNPVCNRCNIRFLVTNQQSVNLSIFDVTGRSIRTVVDAELMPGTYIAEWDCRDSENYLVPSGTYYYILKNGNNLECDKIIVIR